MVKYELYDSNAPERDMDDVTAKAHILKYERMANWWLMVGKISQEEAWDIYFGLLHECDVRNFTEDRWRIHSKIDTTIYDPLASKNPRVVLLARIRARAMKVIDQN